MSVMFLVLVLLANLELCKSSPEQDPGVAPQLASVFPAPARVREAQSRVEKMWQELCGQRHPASNKQLTQDQILLDISAPVSEVDPQFLSVTLGTRKITKNWVNFTAPHIVSMAKGLSPAMLRVGGTDEDYLTFNITGYASVISCIHMHKTQ